MFPRNPLAYWPDFARGRGGAGLAFAWLAGLGDDEHGAQAILPVAQLCLDCYPSPFLWPGPVGVGPLFCPSTRRQFADYDGGRNFRFQATGNAVESVAITTTDRGRLPCRNHFLSQLCLSFRWPDACRTPRRAAWPVQQLARCWPMCWTRMSSPVRRLAAWRALPPAASKSACRPVTDRLTAAAAQPQSKPSGPRARVAFCHARPGEGAFLKGRPCSRRS